MNRAADKIFKFMKNLMSSAVLAAVHVADSVDDDVNMCLGFIFMDGIDGLEAIAQVADDFLGNQICTSGRNPLGWIKRYEKVA